MQQYDAERDELMSKRIAAAAWDGESKSAPQADTPLPTNGRKQTMTAKDIMRNYKR